MEKLTKVILTELNLWDLSCSEESKLKLELAKALTNVIKNCNLHIVKASAFVVWVNHKCIVVIAKTKKEVMDRLREAGIEWNSIKIEPLDAIF